MEVTIVKEVEVREDGKGRQCIGYWAVPGKR
jgi:hypothetical protein